METLWFDYHKTMLTNVLFSNTPLSDHHISGYGTASDVCCMYENRLCFIGVWGDDVQYVLAKDKKIEGNKSILPVIVSHQKCVAEMTLYHSWLWPPTKLPAKK